MVHSSWIVGFILGLCWRIIHLLFSIHQFGSRLVQVVETCIISTGLLCRCRNLKLDRLKYLAVVVDSKEAKDTRKIRKLLSWLANIGVNYVTLYDMEGVLKKSFDGYLKGLSNGMTKAPHQDKISLEVISFSDSKEGVAKAASFLCSKYLRDEIANFNKKESSFSETDMSDALKAVGYGGPEPDLLLVYGPVRCHLGFPAWRLRYTEIVHMGPLKSMKYGAILKAFYEFSLKQQNFGEFKSWII
ncbi:ditrans,polycis-polyprenyl diphosphate synthase [Apostasia shenzhenica]|uniref:ditrans,polycis-polyprenyl diphosphate synthase [(2E,6E)-farnesyldiphosphate specific] n=1 Tax=Apostasia shenzhenica TaxID=1088818 RepID=A0A2I0AWN2_9ASPA|nr:ditrans,polycis-polyprenyl diphosphate synthase [Apostasia shenzhenica]